MGCLCHASRLFFVSPYVKQGISLDRGMSRLTEKLQVERAWRHHGIGREVPTVELVLFAPRLNLFPRLQVQHPPSHDPHPLPAALPRFPSCSMFDFCLLPLRAASFPLPSFATFCSPTFLRALGLLSFSRVSLDRRSLFVCLSARTLLVCLYLVPSLASSPSSSRLASSSSRCRLCACCPLFVLS